MREKKHFSDEQLQAKLALDHSYSQIAKMFGVSKSAVAGRVFRLRMSQLTKGDNQVKLIKGTYGKAAPLKSCKKEIEG